MNKFWKGLGIFFLAMLVLAILLLIFSIVLILGGAVIAIAGLVILISPLVIQKVYKQHDIIPAFLLHPLYGRIAGFIIILLGSLSFTTGQALFAELTENPKTQPVATVAPKQTKKEAPSPSSVETDDRKTRITATVVNVIDGDTLVVKLLGKKETVRMILVDTPETVHPDKPPQPFGKEASDFTKSLLTGKSVELELDVQERDSYGRLLAYVYLDGKSVQEELLAKGLARLAVYPPNVKYENTYREIQEKAQQQKLGIWSIENYVQEDGFHPPKPKAASKPSPSSTSTSKSSSSSSSSSRSSKPRYSLGDKDCSDFRTQREAQAYFKSKGGSRYRNVDGLDRDHDGIACESLP